MLFNNLFIIIIINYIIICGNDTFGLKNGENSPILNFLIARFVCITCIQFIITCDQKKQTNHHRWQNLNNTTVLYTNTTVAEFCFCGNMAELCWPTAALTNTNSLAGRQETERKQQPTSRPCIIHQGCISLYTAGQSRPGREGGTQPDRALAMKLSDLNDLWRKGGELITSWSYRWCLPACIMFWSCHMDHLFY